MNEAIGNKAIKLLLVTLAISTSLGILGSWLVSQFNDFGWNGFMKNTGFMWYYTFLGRSWDFLLAALVGSMLATNKTLLRQRKNILFTWSALVLLITIYLWLTRLQPTAIGWGLGAFHPLGRIAHNAIVPGFLLAFFYGLMTEKTWISRLLSTPIFQILGKSSYVFFLIHYTPIAGWLKRQGLDAYIPFFIGINTMSILLYWFYERPVGNALNTVLRIISTRKLNFAGFWETLNAKN